MKRFMILMVTLSLIILSAVVQAQCVIQLTDNDYEKRYPQIYEGQIVWEQWDGNDWEIYLWDGADILQVTDNDFDDSDSQIHGGKITWNSYDGEDREVFVWNGGTTIRLTDDSFNDGPPQIHNGQVVWIGYNPEDASSNTVYIWDEAGGIRVVDDKFIHSHVRIHNGMVVWESYNDDDYNSIPQVYLWDGYTTTQLSEGEFSEGYYGNSYPEIHNGQVIWDSFETCDTRPCTILYFWDGGSPQEIFGTVGECLGLYNLRINNGYVLCQFCCWHQCYVLNSFYWHGTELNSPSLGMVEPQLDNGLIASTALRSNPPDELISGSDIVLWDGENSVRITDDDIGDYSPDIHNGQIVWVRHDENDYEIFVTCPPRSHDRPADRPGSDSDRDEPEELRFMTIGSEVER